jgi:RNA polymerase sigma factor (sigma-70 family)
VSQGDDVLLARFVVRRDDLAFAELVARHGPLVMAVCRRVLRCEQDAEDAFQATFLVLARKAASLRRAESLPAWLHQTAFRLALRARANGARRREQSLEADAMIAAEPLSQITSDFEQSALDEELNRLPKRYRLPVFLCCIEGQSREQAAEQLGWSLGSLKGRLERARQLLRRRLLLRGVSLSVALALAAATKQAVGASLSPSLIAATVQAGLQYAAGQSVVGYVSQNALSLAQGSLNIMSITAVKVGVCSMLIAGGLAVAGQVLPAPVLAGKVGTSQALALEDGSSSSGGYIVFLQEDKPRREGEARPDGDRPREEPRPDQPRERDARPDQPRERDARPDQPRPDQPREGDRPREGEVRRDGERPREGAREGEVPEILRNFRPANQREAALAQMIMALQREVTALRAEVARMRGGRDGEVRRDGEIRRDGEQPRPDARDGERPREGARDGERPREGERDGDRPQTDAPRESDRPRTDAPRDDDR